MHSGSGFLALTFLFAAAVVRAESVEVGPLRIRVEVPKGYRVVFEDPARTLVLLSRPAKRPGARPDELVLSTEALPSATASPPLWVTGHEFTWGSECAGTAYLSLGWELLDPRARVSEGYRMIGGIWENRFAALLPVRGVGLVVFLCGNDSLARGRLHEDLRTLALSVGARPAAAGMPRGFCGGCIVGPGSGLSSSQQTLLMGGAFLATLVFGGWLTLKVLERAIARW